MPDIVKDVNFFVDNVEKVVLECVDPDNNHNKYYHLSRSKTDKGKVLAQWGRIGSKHQSKMYDVYELTNMTAYQNAERLDGYAMHIQMKKKIAKGYELKTYKCFGDASSAYLEFMNYLGDEGVELFDDEEFDRLFGG
jgi:predicted DNA-binding WGR domain protein